MKVLVSVAVFGLVPIPIAVCDNDSRDDHQTMGDDARFSSLLYLPRPAIERMAPIEELAVKRIYRVSADLGGQRILKVRRSSVAVASFTPYRPRRE